MTTLLKQADSAHAAPVTKLDSVRSNRSVLVSVLNSIPTVLTLGLLGGVAALGHHYGWKLPKASEFGITAAAVHGSAEEWCAEHNVSEAVCVECNNDLMAYCTKPRWCKEHGVSECPTHHLELAQVNGQPRLPQYDTVAALGLLDRAENNSRCKKFLRRIQYESVVAFDKMGIDVDVVTERPMTESLRMNGELGYDQSQLAHLSTRSAGSVWKVFKRLGDEVKTGEVLALVDAIEVGQSKAELARAVIQFQTRKRTWENLKSISGAVPERTVREAQSAFEEAEIGMTMATQALVNLGFEVPGEVSTFNSGRLTRSLQCLGLSEELCGQLGTGHAMTMNLIPIVAPQDGVIVEMDVVAGEVVQPDNSLLTLANLERMWLTLHVKQEDASYLSLGQKVKFKPDGAKREIEGALSFISPAVDEQTRTLRVRAILDNTDHKLKANSFGTGWIVLREEPKAVTVPLDTLQSDGDCQIVFVRDKDFLKDGSPKVFHARQVRVGAKSDSHIELLAGVLPGEVVASKGSAALRSELLKSSLGSGCGCGH